MTKKGQKKKSMKLRKQIRKTLGSVCLITALIVAAIPVPEASADTTVDAVKYTWDNEIGKAKTVIPTIPKDCDTIYTTGDGVFQFAFVNASDTSPDKIAVVLGYNANTLANNYLEIPDTVDAFTKFSENEGSRTGYVAVSRSQKPLYYMSKAPEYKVDVSTGNVTGEMVSPAEYSPCYYTDYDKWSSLDLAEFYYKDAAGSFQPTISTTEQWIKNLDVMYIGNQSLTANPDAVNSDGAVQEWIIAEGTRGTDKEINIDPEKGVFANESNIRTLVVGDSLMGIGNYAFYGCTALESITLGNGLTEIGKYAFANCVNMSNIGIDFASRLQYISDYTFLNCRALRSFTLPSSVTTIYDHAFEGCSSLGKGAGSILDISGLQANKNVTLQRLGYYVFRGCTGLADVVFPDSINSAQNPVNLNIFEGCSDLQRIKAESPYTVFEGMNSYTAQDFKEDVRETFYFEAEGTSATHTFTQENVIAFKYADDDRYEIIILEKDTDGDGQEDDPEVKLTYQVNSNNELLYFNMTGKVAKVEIPATIGPYGISAINSGSFSGNCFLEKITIPSTVSRINDGAFKGCHNLKHVIFEDAGTISYIGNDAFATQVVELHDNSCTNKEFLTTVKSPTLTFTGTVGTGIVPYDYAMNATSTINAGPQTKTYITYYSGWPTNQEIRYVVDDETGLGKATLVDYPTYDELAKGVNGKYTSDNYPYITDEYEDAAREAISKYQAWLSNPGVEVTSNQWDIINAALELSVPAGVKAYATGLFSGVTGEIKTGADGKEIMNVVSVNGQAADTNIQKITFADIDEFAPYSFSGCTALERVDITGGTSSLEDYAFASAYTDAAKETGSVSVLETVNMRDGGSSVGNYAFCNNPMLENVTISALVDTMGIRPFKDCTLLESVNFSGSPYFTCEDAIVYGLADGKKDSVVQCLETRGQMTTAGSIGAGELSGVTGLYEEAFMDCTEIGSIDMSSSLVSEIPANAFDGTESLYSIVLSTSTKAISKNAFNDSNVRYVDIPSSVTFIDPAAFNTPANLNANGKYNTIEFYCEAGSAAETYANQNENIMITDKPITTTFKVIFWGMDGAIIEEQNVLIGEDAIAPKAPEIADYKFTGWLPANFAAVSRDMDIVAQYEKIDSTEKMVTVTFLDWDDKVLKTDRVTPGNDAQPPLDPVRDGYTFMGWRPAVTNIQEDTTIYAQYEKNDSSDSQFTVRFIDWDDTVLYTLKVNEGEDAISPQVPGRDGYEFTGWRPDVKNITKDLDTYAQYEKSDSSGSGSGEDGDEDGDGDGTSTKLYTLTVQNGSGSGSYAAGSQPIVIANDPASGMAFSHWTIDPEDTKIASRVLTATVITMPDENVTVTAHYKKSTGATVVTGTGNSSNNNYRPGTNSGTISNGGTTVVIDKNGLSNTGVVSATVNGSSDNFTIKITESNSATESVIKALMSEYGDISNIKYFPMDISLYDSTGKKKITDTKGLSISITLPLPDSLITYAGNNKVAGVVNDKLDKLSPRFTTISGVSCVTFTAEHFSPYVIYVDTENLTAGTVIDSTPKTGDGIHPKWFLSIGLACLSAVLFMKKDKKVPQRVRVRA